MPIPAKRLARSIARKIIRAGNIDPALVKAVLRKPPPVNGGPRTRRWPWPRRRHFDRQDRRAVMRLMTREIRRGGAIVYNGPETREYCAAFARYLGGGFAYAVNSGTNAVYVALRALDLEPGTEIIVPPITDAGGTMPVVMANCVPIPADSDPGALNTSAEQIRRVLTARTGAIVVAHISGHPLDMDPIMQLAEERGIPVIEDCAQAQGALYKGRMIGTLGAIATFSTMFGKHHSTGAQGGVVFTRDTLLFARLRQLADRGKPYGAVNGAGNLIASLNFNQDEISMAIGRVQLAKLPGFLDARRRFVALVQAGLKDVQGVSLVPPPPDSVGAYWFLLLKLDFAKLRCTADEFGAALEAEGIGGVAGGYPFFPTDHPWHRDAVVIGTGGLPWSLLQTKPQHFELPNAHAANAAMIRIDVHEGLGPREARDLVNAVGKLARYFALPTAGTGADEAHAGKEMLEVVA